MTLWLMIQCYLGRNKSKELFGGKMVVWGGLRNSYEKKRSKRQRRKNKRYTHLNAELQRIARRDMEALQRNRGKQQNGKDKRSIQEN